MTTPDVQPEPMEEEIIATEEGDEKNRRLLLVLLLLLLLLCCVGSLFLRYLLKPQPLTDMLPAPLVQNLNFPPTYKSSITGLDEPVGVAVSPDNQLIYVVESAGERLIKAFDRNGNLIYSFAPPGTNRSNRKPTYIAVDVQGRVFVADTYNDVIAIFDAKGNFIDGIINPDTSLREAIAAHIGRDVPEGTVFYYNKINSAVEYILPGEQAISIPGPSQMGWSPVGLRFDAQGNLMITNIVAGQHAVIVYDAASINTLGTSAFNPQTQTFGKEGQDGGQFSFPNAVVRDSLGNYYVSDGNNGRISAWTTARDYKTFFGFGSSETSLNLPRGMWMDGRDRLHVADAIGQYIRVYDVSAEEPAFLFNFGAFGDGDGEFNFPIDICLDGTGRLYIADRENNRVQIWSY